MPLPCFAKWLLPPVLLSLSACSAEPAETVAPREQESTPPVTVPEEDKVRDEPPPVVKDAPPPQKDANGCVTIQAPGHWEGEGLAKHYVPGPLLKQCDMQPLPVPLRAEEPSASETR